MRVGIFVTCVTDTLLPRTGVATVELLERLGCTVEHPAEQTCCGQMHANAGYPGEVLGLVRRFARVFGDPRFDAIVSPSASCVATVHEQYEWLAERAGDRALLTAVRALAPRVHELSRFLVEVFEVEDVGARYPHRVAYHPTCHSLRSERVGDAPLRLLRNVRELENADTSVAMLADKLRALAGSGAQACTALDDSCLLHIGGGLSRARSPLRAVHLAEILAAT